MAQDNQLIRSLIESSRKGNKSAFEQLFQMHVGYVFAISIRLLSNLEDAYENTSNVDIIKEKKLHGDKVTIVGGVGVDYLLTDRSQDHEVEEEVKRLIAELGPGGRFIIAPVHSLSTIPAHKLRIMVDAVKQYGTYPISLQATSKEALI